MAMDDEDKPGNKRLLEPTGEEDDEPANKKRAATADKDWNVDECRGDHESVEHWELRKQFLVQNKERFPNRNRLICLSQVFANMEFLGCRYPEETMELVQELSLGIVESYREKQKSRLQRTFVKASDAAERKTKGSSSNYASISTSKSIDHKTISHSHLDSQPVKTTTEITVPNNFLRSDTATETSLLADLELQSMILLVFAYNNGENPVQIIHRSCQASNTALNIDISGSSSGNYVCTYGIGKRLVVHSNEGHPTKESAKADAAKQAFEILQKRCFTFLTKTKIMPSFDGKEVAKEEIDGNAVPVHTDPKIGADNIGNKLLKLMGWSGGGLGKNEQGIQEAISVDGTVGRNRLGLGNDTVSFVKKIRELLEKQKRDGFTHDLKFASDFSKDERKEIHLYGIAKRLKLKSKSYGKEDDRYIVISEKVSRPNLLRSILAEGGETDRYKVIPPGGSLEGLEMFL